MQIKITNPFVLSNERSECIEGSWFDTAFGLLTTNGGKTLSHILLFTLILTSSLSAAPRISIISFIEERSPIHELIKNVTSQTNFNECELILVSTADNLAQEDSILNFCDEYVNIQYMPFLGINNQTALLNHAIIKSQGEYVTIVTPEDSHNPAIFTLYAETLDTTPSIDLVYADTFIRYEPNTSYQAAAENGWYCVHKGEFSPQLLFYNLPGNQCMWRKAMHTKYGLFDESFRFFSMLEFWNRSVSNGCLFKKVPAISGIGYLAYCNAKKLFNSFQDNQKGYEEKKHIKNAYGFLWRTSMPQHDELQFVIITPSYRNKEWYKRNLDSVFNQNYTNYRIIYIDDTSPDDTGNLVEEYTKECHQEYKVTLIKNDERVGALANIYKAVHMCKPEEIVVLVDGDDWLAHENVLAYLNAVYHNPEVWITYGQFIWFPAEKEGFTCPINKQTVTDNSFRYSAWSASHLRTFYAGLFHKITMDDLLFENNKFYTMCWDLAIMYPMIEMAGFHNHFVPDIVYVYNNDNNINDHKVNIDLQGAMGRHILNRPRYEPIASLF